MLLASPPYLPARSHKVIHLDLLHMLRIHLLIDIHSRLHRLLKGVHPRLLALTLEIRGLLSVELDREVGGLREEKSSA